MFKHHFDIPEDKKIRVIINSDAKNEADDQYAIVHALLTPRFNIKGIIAAHFGEHRTTTSMEQSYEEIIKILKLMNLEGQIPVARGAKKAIIDEHTPALSEGAQLIINEALSDDPKPLFVIFLGPITDLASAYLMEPSIADKLTAVWVGCGAWPEGEDEFNLANDIHAANVVFQSTIPTWIIPRNVYSSIRVSIAELAVKVKPYGDVGNYLYQQLIDFNNERGQRPGWPKGEMWSLGDSPAVSVLIDDHEYGFTLQPAPQITKDMRYIHYQKERLLRWYHFIDSRFTLEDMFAKLQLHYSNNERN